MELSGGHLPLFVGSTNLMYEQPKIYYHIICIADVTSWYHKQFENEEDSVLFELTGNSMINSVKKSFNVKVDDKIYVYMVNKVYGLNGHTHTKSHIMISNNFDIFDDLSKLNKRDYKLYDLFDIEQQRNIKNTSIIYNIDTHKDILDDDYLTFNMLNYEVNIYKYLSNLGWIGEDFTSINVYDLYENDKTVNTISRIKVLQKRKNKEVNDDEILELEFDMRNFCPETPIKKLKKNA